MRLGLCRAFVRQLLCYHRLPLCFALIYDANRLSRSLPLSRCCLVYCHCCLPLCYYRCAMIGTPATCEIVVLLSSDSFCGHHDHPLSSMRPASPLAVFCISFPMSSPWMFLSCLLSASQGLSPPARPSTNICLKTRKTLKNI